jgi:hypothetical protein
VRQERKSDSRRPEPENIARRVPEREKLAVERTSVFGMSSEIEKSGWRRNPAEKSAGDD